MTSKQPSPPSPANNQQNPYLYCGFALGVLAAGLRLKYHFDSKGPQALTKVKICKNVTEAQRCGDGAYVLFQGSAENPDPARCEYNQKGERGYNMPVIAVKSEMIFVGKTKETVGNKEVWKEGTFPVHKSFKAPPFRIQDTSGSFIQIPEFPVDTPNGLPLKQVTDSFKILHTPFQSLLPKEDRNPTSSKHPFAPKPATPATTDINFVPLARLRSEWAFPLHSTVTALGVLRKTSEGQFALFPEGKPYYITTKTPEEIQKEVSSQGIYYYYGYLTAVGLCGLSFAAAAWKKRNNQ